MSHAETGSPVERKLPDDQVKGDVKDDVGDSDLLATLNAEQEQVVQMRKLAEATVRPGLLKLPVKKVITAENSAQYAIVMDHPTLKEKTMRFYYKKPERGWTTEEPLPSLMDSYGVRGENPYHLQLHHLYVEYDNEESDWHIIEQPSEAKQLVWRNESRINNIRASLKENIPMQKKLALGYSLLKLAVVGKNNTAKSLLPQGGVNTLGAFAITGAFIALTAVFFTSGIGGNVGLFSAVLLALKAGLAVGIGSAIATAIGIMALSPPGGDN